MSRPKTSVNRLDNLRKAFKTHSGKVLSEKQVFDAVGASYWRACIKDLKAEGMNIESVREGRAVVGYKYVDIKGGSGKTAKVEVTTEKAAVAASKPKKAAKGKATKATTPAKKTKTNVVAVVEAIEPEGDEDPDVLAILKQAGL